MATVATATITTTTAVTLAPCPQCCEEPAGHPLDYLRRRLAPADRRARCSLGDALSQAAMRAASTS
jgi:hypothetical protein